MTTNLQNSPYLPRQRNFPNRDSQELGVELDKTYIDIASRVNERTIGLYSNNLPSITGEAWYLTGQTNKNQTLRRVYEFTAVTPIPHGLNFSQLSYMTEMRGQYTDGVNWYGLIAASNVPIPGQISFYLDPTFINIVVGAGSPALANGKAIIILEWLSAV